MSAKLIGQALDADMPTHVAKLILMKLADAAEPDGTSIWPSVATIARVVSCSPRHVTRMLKLFVSVGLLVVVRRGGAGPGDTNEYRIDLAVFRRLVDDGWDAAFGAVDAADKGDSMESPLAGSEDAAQKGDMVSPLKGDSGGKKGDIGGEKGDSIESDNPSYRPLPSRPVERNAREEGGEAEHIPNADLLARLKREYPHASHADQDEVDAAWRALSPALRREAVDELAAWLADKGPRQAVLGLPKYLRQKPWQLVAERRAAAGGAAGLKPRAGAFTRAWWWLFHEHCRAWEAQLRNRNSPASQHLRHRVSTAVAYAAGWIVEDEGQLAAAEERSQHLVQVHRDDPRVEAWRRHYGERGIDMPIPDKAEWLFIPAEGP